LLTLAQPPTALFAYNDMMALGVLRACHALGRRVPADVAVVGFGGAPMAEWLTPSLTTVEVPLYCIGHAAADALLQMLRDDRPVNSSIGVEPVLLVRESSGGPN
jgi:DNA-binding LacI/PurR family transcriptional regulator